MKNKNAIAILSLTFGILIVCSIVVYSLTTQPEIEKQKIEKIKQAEIKKVAEINKANEGFVFDGLKKYKVEQTLVTKDKKHKVQILSNEGKYYFSNVNNNKSEPFDKITNLKLHIYNDVGHIYFTDYTKKDIETYEFIGTKNNIDSLYLVNGFGINTDCEKTSKCTNTLSGSGIDNIYILSPDASVTIAINGIGCSVGQVSKGDNTNYLDPNDESDIVCTSYEVIKNGKLLGKYEKIKDLVFKPYSSEMFYIVGEKCSSNSECKNYYIVSDTSKTPIYNGIYNITFNNSVNDLAYLSYDASKNKYSVVVNGIKQSSYDYIFGNTLQFDSYGKIGYIAANKCFVDDCFEKGTSGGASKNVFCNDYYLVAKDQKPLKINGGGITPLLFYAKDKDYNEHAFYNTGVDCSPLGLKKVNYSSILGSRSQCYSTTTGGCFSAQLKSTGGFLGGEFDDIASVTLSSDQKHFAYIAKGFYNIDKSCEYFKNHKNDNCYKDRIVTDDSNMNISCERITNLSINANTSKSTSNISQENILNYDCINNGNTTKMTIGLP